MSEALDKKFEDPEFARLVAEAQPANRYYRLPGRLGPLRS